VSADGRVWSTARGPFRELSPYIVTVREGYRRAQVSFGGKTRKVATLVCTAFHGPRPDGHEAAHLNGNPLDNRAENLAWKTPAANQADRIEHGTSNRGSQHGRAKLTEDDVHEIRRMAAAGSPQAEITARFGIAQTTVSQIDTRKTWSWLE
jgi:hypothetical protein